ncbi:MAG: VOC family protein [Myxococcales bacterium]|nr:VOC family protein [Myxococcales bacterium]
MRPPPRGWPRISSSVFYDDAGAAIDWLSRAFGFEVQLRIEGEGGRIEHSQLVFGEGLVMVGSAGGSSHRDEPLPAQSPRSVGGVNTQMLCVFVDDVDAHCARARAAGAEILDEPTTTDYGDDYWSDRSYRAMDPEGHQWWFMQRMRDRADP